MDRKSWSGAVCWLWQCVIWNAISQEQHQSGHHTEFHKLLAPCCLDTLLPEPVYYDLAHCYHSCILYGKEGGGADCAFEYTVTTVSQVFFYYIQADFSPLLLLPLTLGSQGLAIFTDKIWSFVPSASGIWEERKRRKCDYLWVPLQYS